MDEIYKLWVKIFSLSFAFGVVSGVTMSFQFGTNWPGFMKTVGNIAGPLLAYEVLSAFFLEATFLSIMLYGFNKVPNIIHTISTFLVAFGTTISAFLDISTKLWMHTPSGFKMLDGKAYVTSWLKVILNPSMPYRLSHMLVASGLTASFLIAGVGAYQYKKFGNKPEIITTLKSGIYTASILIILQIFLGDQHGLNSFKYEPAKISALEAIWETEKSAGLRLFAIPDDKRQMNHLEIVIPKLGSIVLTHSADGVIKGIKSFKYHPPVAPMFFSFRIMVGIGILMLISAWYTAYLLHKNKRIKNYILYSLILMTFSGWVGSIAGWYTTEIGRQPWLVQNLLLTKDAVANNITTNMLTSSLLLYITTYCILLVIFISVVFYIAYKHNTNGNN